MGEGAPRFLAAALAVAAVGLCFEAPPAVTGDAVEYIAYTHNLAEWRSPRLSEADIDSVEALLLRHGHEFGGRLARPPLETGEGSHVLTHFWLYSALAVPFWWVLSPFDVHPTIPFAALNLTLLVLVARALFARLRTTGTLLLLGGPVVWWIDKAQVEVFVFALGALALSLVDDHPGISMILTGAVAAQFPPFAAVVVAIGVGVYLRDRRFAPAEVAGLFTGLALAASHPGYFLWRTGSASPLAGTGGRFELPPSVERLGAVLWDPNVGFLFNAPLLAIALFAIVVGVLLRDRPGLRANPGLACGVITLPILLVSLSVPNNFDHGGTPGMSRYVLVLLPLAVPWLAHVARSAGGTWTTLVAATVASCVWSLIYFRPSVPEQQHVPTRVAAGQWTHYPGAHDPLPEIFGERVRRIEPAAFPTATHNCTKVLLLGGNWPVPCVPAAVLPPPCCRPGAICYANWGSAAYEVEPFAPSAEGYEFDAEPRTWPLPQASLELAVAASGGDESRCREIGRGLGVSGEDRRGALRRIERRGLWATTTLRGRLAAWRPALRDLLRGSVPKDTVYEAACGLPGPATGPRLRRFLAAGTQSDLARLPAGDPVGKVAAVDGAPWTESVEDSGRLLLYVPARATAATIRLRLDGAWNGAQVFADDGNERVPIELEALATPPGASRRLRLGASGRDVAVVLIRAS